MAVDGVGNKWIGTDNGIFVVSPDGSDSVAHYTAENSPLVNDQVNSIAIDPARGETYAGTPAGISRFSTIFKQGQPDYTGIRVYPNPVVQTAEGTPSGSPTVYIDGLVAGSTVQIFSLAGKLNHHDRWNASWFHCYLERTRCVRTASAQRHVSHQRHLPASRNQWRSKSRHCSKTLELNSRVEGRTQELSCSPSHLSSFIFHLFPKHAHLRIPLQILPPNYRCLSAHERCPAPEMPPLR